MSSLDPLDGAIGSQCTQKIQWYHSVGAIRTNGAAEYSMEFDPSVQMDPRAPLGPLYNVTIQ